jgi:uncharacterized membrane protein
MITAAASTGNGPGGTILAIVITIVVIAFYWLPSFVAWRRGARNLGSIIVINFFAFFLMIPWIIALAMALADPRRAEAR